LSEHDREIASSSGEEGKYLNSETLVSFFHALKALLEFLVENYKIFVFTIIKNNENISF
jgi:hypothetical protein